jgi:prepilin-type N-terminal cleavage/methylation domain-containing protein
MHLVRARNDFRMAAAAGARWPRVPGFSRNAEAGTKLARVGCTISRINRERKQMHKQRGFTLIEIAIVLVIIGLLLGGVLKGQELITSARVRNLISQQDGVKAAYFGFLDRYRALPGDYLAAAAIANINGVVAGVCAGGGNGNGQIEPGNEAMIAWEHLSRAGFINGSYTCGAGPTNQSNPANPYGTLMQLVYDNAYDSAPAAATDRHNVKTGNQIPSDILAEVDRKADDGVATGGTFRFSVYNGGGAGVPPVGLGTCYLAAAVPANGWSAANVVTNCGGASLF